MNMTDTTNTFLIEKASKFLKVDMYILLLAEIYDGNVVIHVEVGHIGALVFRCSSCVTRCDQDSFNLNKENKYVS